MRFASPCVKLARSSGDGSGPASEGKLTRHKAGRVYRVSRIELERLLKSGASASNDSTPEELAVKMFG